LRSRRSRALLLSRLVLSIWGLFLALLLILLAAGYLAMRIAANQLIPRLTAHTTELHARAAETLLMQAEQSVTRLHAALLHRLQHADPDTTLARFDTLFTLSADGLWRLRPEWHDPRTAPVLSLRQPPGGLDTSARLRAVVAYDLLREQGPALVPPFHSVYMEFVENGRLVYATARDRSEAAHASDTHAGGYPTMQEADPRRNPARRLFWTPMYFDQQAGTWMVSVIQPLDWQGRWVGTLGHDIALPTLLQQNIHEDMLGGMSIVISPHGHLMAPPRLLPRPAGQPQRLDNTRLDTPDLKQTLASIRAAKQEHGARRSPDGRLWVAWATIHGPGWYQVYLLPQAQIDRLLMAGLAMLLILGVLGLLPVMWLLRRRIDRLIAVPLRQLTRAVDELSQGLDPNPIVLQGDDELSRLARAFNDMVEELAQQRALQQSHAQALQSEIDERHRFMQRLEEEHTRLHTLLEAMHQGILFVNAQQEVVYCNARFLRTWGFADASQLVGRSAAEGLVNVLPLVADPASLQARFAHSISHPLEEAHFEIVLNDGRIITHDAYPLQDAQGQHIGRLWVQEDVTRERQMAAQLAQLAEQDPLTGLFNRRRFESDLDACFRVAPNADTSLALLFFDLDEFKYVNDTYGHRAGDIVLKRVATEVLTLLGERESFYRLGGDEFAILMHKARLHEASQMAERIVRRLAQLPIEIAGETLRLTASVGIAHAPTHASSGEDLAAHADIAMYQSKHSGKNRWSIYRPDHDASRAMALHLSWNDRIAHALDHGLLRLHFQGIYRARDGQLEHLEALLRMEDSEHPGTLIMPAEFIPHAEKSGKILDIDRWVIRQSIDLLYRHPHLPALAINISGRSLDDPDLPGFIAGQLEQHRVSPKRLLVELTETAAVTDMGDAARFIAALRRTGCPICLDDFGTGFASFAYLKHLKADTLKIDGMFIRDLPRDNDSQVFVRSIIDVAHGMGKQTVAEFVEDGRTLLMLREMGVDMVQGYHLDRPKADHPALHHLPWSSRP